MPTVVQDVSGDSALQTAIAALKAKIEGAEESSDITQAVSQINTALGKKQDKLTFDSTPTAGSTKPVTSGGIKTALDGKQNTLIFDAEPTAKSTKPVTSGGVKEALDDMYSEISDRIATAEDAIDISASGIYDTASGSIAFFSDGADDLPLKSCVVKMEPIQEGEGDPSPENVRPIIGLDSVEVNRTGFNQWNEEWEKGGINAASGMPANVSNRIRSKNFSPCWGGVKYYVHIEFDVPIRIFWYDSDRNYITYQGGQKFVTTSPNNTRYFKVSVEGNTYGETYRHDICINPSDPAKNGTYEPYEGNTYFINWELEAGTVYGGKLDVVSGKLTVDRAYIASYNGEALPSTWVSDRDVYSAGTTPTAGAQVVYELAEPIEYQLNAQEIRTLLGVNHVWSEGGDVEVEYPADTKLYIQRLTGSDEDDMVANSNIPDATYFLISNTLYKSTVAIASGDPIVPGTNCMVTNLAEALNALNTTT